jgi:predicted membrane channel-forming protein YqfA (hemolysin III family)
VQNEKVLKFLVTWLVNTIVVMIVSSVLGDNFVLGNDKVAKSMAAVLAGLILTLIASWVPKIVSYSSYKVKNHYLWLVFYLVANFLGLWVIKRLAQVTGLGIANNLYVFVAALTLTVVGWGFFESVKKTSLGRFLKQG